MTNGKHDKIAVVGPVPQTTTGFLAFKGKVIIGDGNVKPITADSLKIHVSKKDAEKGEEVDIIEGTNSSGTRKKELSLKDSEFEFLIPTVNKKNTKFHFSGFLVISAKWKEKNEENATAILPIEITEGDKEIRRVIILSPDKEKKYLWFKVEAMERELNGNVTNVAIPDAKGTIIVKFRDQINTQSYYRVPFTTGSDGKANFESKESIFAIPIKIAVLVRTEFDEKIFGRADFFIFKDTQRQTTPSAITIGIVKRSGSAFKDKVIILDPGHGVNYEDKEKRLYEWYVAHRITQKIDEIWKKEGGTAKHVPSARFQVAGLKIKVKDPRLDALHSKLEDEIKNPDIQLTIDRSKNDFTMEFLKDNVDLVKVADSLGHKNNRDGFVNDHKELFKKLEKKVPAPTGFTLVEESSAFDKDKKKFMVTFKKGTEEKKLAIEKMKNESFLLKDTAVDSLAEASVIESWKTEMKEAFKKILKDKSSDEPNSSLLEHAKKGVRDESRSLSIKQRKIFLDKVKASTAAIVTVHHNAAGGTGTEALLPKDAKEKSPMSRTGKRYLKYVDPLGNGKHGSGLKPKSDVGLVNPPPSESNYVYLEIDFMDTEEKSAPGGIRYGLMDDESRFIVPAAKQIISTVMEMLSGPQSDSDLDDASMGFG